MNERAARLRNHLQIRESIAIHLMLVNVEHLGEEDVREGCGDEFRRD